MSNVLIFDSGVGGLSVYQEVYKKMPFNRYYYVFDNALFPYGILDERDLIKRVNKIIKHCVDKYEIDLVIVACNTASTIALESLRKKILIPIVGVVPAIKTASIITESKSIALLATPATIKREYLDTLIEKFAYSVNVSRIGTTELVKLAEKKVRCANYDKNKAITIISKILKALPTTIDCLVLGCTHFPLMKDEISQVYKNSIKIIDSGEAIANRVCSLLGEVISPNDNLTNIQNFTLCTKKIESTLTLDNYLKKIHLSPVKILVNHNF